MKASIAALLFLVSSPAFAEGDAASTRDDVQSCWNLQSQAGQERCLAGIGEELEAKRKRLRDQRIELTYNTGLERQILAASEAWTKLRQSECSVVNDQFESASLQGAKVTECEIYFTLQRIEDLQHYTGCTENGCPWFF